MVSAAESSPIPPSRFRYEPISMDDHDSSSSIHFDSLSSTRLSSRKVDKSQLMNRLRFNMMGETINDIMFQPQSRPSRGNVLLRALGQVPAILLVEMLYLMMAIPFGVSYFPIGWRVDAASATTPCEASAEDSVYGPFPLPGKEALGIRMFLFATVIGQVVYTFTSQFPNPIGLQMIENVPFCHELAVIVVSRQGYGIDALSTLFFLMAFASVVVGIVFYLLGALNLGRVVYFIPTHVLVGCISGIGVFIAKTGVEVTVDATFSLSSISSHWNLLSVVFAFEIVLRIMELCTRDKEGRPRYPLLSPIYFCLITPAFYLFMWILQVPMQQAVDDGFFFPPLDQEAASINATSILGANATLSQMATTTTTTTTTLFDSIIHDEHMWDMWRVFDIRLVSWRAVVQSIPTLIALTLFSLIHVPINIPAFSLTTRVDVDMNNELIAHGYSNLLSGLMGGLQNYMAYTHSVVYYKSGGTGRRSGCALALLTAFMFVMGPTIASFIPRCMAGTLLFHVGTDLFLEGVYDAFGKYDWLEYFGIWLIVIVMTLFGMDAAMIAGVIAAVSTYSVQSIAYLNPIRGSMSAVTLRSSHRSRPPETHGMLLEGRKHILVVQLQGHLFFGNVAHFTESIYELLRRERPWIVILDFSLVLGIDTSAVQAITKMRSALQKKHCVQLSIFVSGSTEGFPCEYDLTAELSSPLEVNGISSPRENGHDKSYENGHGKSYENGHGKSYENGHGKSYENGHGKSYENGHGKSYENGNGISHENGNGKPLVDPPVVNETTKLLLSFQSPDGNGLYFGSCVCESLDCALIRAEDAVIAMHDPSLLDTMPEVGEFGGNGGGATPLPSLAEEKTAAIRYLRNLCHKKVDTDDLKLLFSCFEREVYIKGDFVWRQGDESNCAKLIVSGYMVGILENERGTKEPLKIGCMIGELGLVQGDCRMSSVQCVSDQAVAYSLSRESFEALAESNPHVARIMDLICIKYLANRVQHVSNRIFETRCLPV